MPPLFRPSPEARLRRARRRVRAALRAVFLLFLVLIGVLAWLQIAGVPRPLREALFREWRPGGLRAEADALRLHLPDGLRAENLRLFQSHDLVSPLLQAERADLRFGLYAWLRHRRPQGSVGLAGGQLRAQMEQWTGDLRTDRVLELTQMQGRLHLLSDRLRLEGVQARCAGVDLQVSGDISTQAFQESGEPKTAYPLAAPARVVAQALDFMEQVHLDAPATCEITLNLPAAPQPPQLHASLRVPDPLEVRGVVLDSLHAELTMDGPDFVLSPLVLTHGGQSFEAAARYHVDSTVLQVDLTNRLSRAHVEQLTPPFVLTYLEQQGLRFDGEMEFDLTIGPSPWSRFGSSLGGSIHLTDAFYLDAAVPEVRLDLGLHDDVLTLTNLVGEVGTGSSRGPVAGHIVLDFTSGSTLVGLRTGFDPLLCAGAFGPVVEDILRDFTFPTAAPQVDLKVQTAGGPDGPIRVEARVESGTTICKGTVLDELKVDVLYQDHVLALSNLRARRAGGVLSGDLVHGGLAQELHLDLVSSIPPPAFARLAGDELVRAFAPYRFNGTNLVEVSGRFDLNNRDHRLNGSLRASHAAWRWLQLEEVAFTFALNGNTLVIPDLHGSLKDGVLAATLLLDQLDDPARARFHVVAKAYDLDLFEAINASMDLEDNPYRGKLSFDVTLEGDVRDQGALRSYEGAGRLSITEGTLYRIPLLFGLSRILSRVVSGFGYAAQTDFTADVTVRDGRMSSDNLFLKGALLSIKGNGYIGFNRSLKINLQIKLLKEGLLAEALQLITWPITKLIEIQVTGTLDEPEWTARNLPF